MSKRSRAVTVISWICIALGIGGLTGLLPIPTLPGIVERRAEVQLQDPLAYALRFIGQPFLLAMSGVFMLRRSSWTRWMLLALLGLSVLVGLLKSAWGVLFPGLPYICAMYWLFLPEASRFFGWVDRRPLEPSKPDDRPDA